MTDKERQKAIELFIWATDFKEAALFEARVAAKLAKLDCVLKYARLAVEEEMDAN